MLAVLDTIILWVNPDYGLKTCKMEQIATHNEAAKFAFLHFTYGVRSISLNKVMFLGVCLTSIDAHFLIYLIIFHIKALVLAFPLNFTL